jgi:predicted ArsR family transcriptional regulator
MNFDPDRPWAKGLRELILVHLTERGPMTPRELANFCQVKVEAVAPRMTELLAQGRVRDTGERRHSVSGKGRTQKVWEALP